MNIFKERKKERGMWTFLKEKDRKKPSENFERKKERMNERKKSVIMIPKTKTKTLNNVKKKEKS